MKRSSYRTRRQHPFNTAEAAADYLEKEGFECIRGCWMRGRNEYALIENASSGVLVLIGNRYL